jgi:hypothetical protein
VTNKKDGSSSGVNDTQQRISIAEDGFKLHNNVMSSTEKDIGNLVKGFAKRTAADGRINFGLKGSNLLKATTHWAQDFRCISRAATLAGINDAAKLGTRIKFATTMLKNKTA